MPPTPMMGKDLLLFCAKKRITSVERFVKGLPESPPVSFLLVDFKPSRERVVLVAITPAILVVFIISIMSNNCSSVKSGAIFNNIGFALGFSRFFVCKVDNKIGRASCRERV